MAGWKTTILVALATLLASVIINRFNTRRRHAAEARRLGCRPVPKHADSTLLGIGAIRRLLAADREMRTPEHLRSLLATCRGPTPPPQQKNDDANSRNSPPSPSPSPPPLTYAYSVGITNGIFTADEVLIQAVLAHQFNDFEIGDGRRKLTAPFLGSGIFTQDGEAWRQSRALLRPAFSREQVVADLELDETHVQGLMMCLAPVSTAPAPGPPTARSGPDDADDDGGWTGEVDLQELLFRYALDSATEYLFGASVGSQLRELRRHREKRVSSPDDARGRSSSPTSEGNVHAREGDVDFAAAFDKAMECISIRSQYMDLGHMVWPRGYSQACKDCHAYVDKYVERQLAHLDDDSMRSGTRKSPTDSAEGGPEIDEDGDDGNDDKSSSSSRFSTTHTHTKKYVFLDALAASTRDPLELRSQLLNILIAGRDTTASLLSWVFYMLARDPARYAKLRAAVLASFGDGTPPSSSSPNSSKPTMTFTSLKECAYLQHVLSETLRLCPIVPFNSRKAARDTTLPRGGGADGTAKVFVPKGTTVSYGVYVLHRRKDIWGEDADQFVPERWAGRKTGWEYLPFNGGPRICLGQQLALTKAAYTTARLVQRFDRIENLDPSPVKHRVKATMSSGTGVRVRFHVAKNHLEWLSSVPRYLDI